MPNIFTPIKYDGPEDICFYKNKKIWVVSISHENLAFTIDPKDTDLEFLKANKIDYYEFF